MGTTTPNLGLYKPSAGEDSWATLVNANMDTLDLTPTDYACYAETRSPRLPTGAKGQTFDPSMPWMQDTGGWNSGYLWLTPIVLSRGDTITSISVSSGATAAISPTHWWFALYDSSYNLLKQTADQTSTAWAGATTKTVNLSSTQLLTYSGLYYVGHMMTAGTGVSLVVSGWGYYGPLATQLGRTGQSTTGLTTTAPATADTPSNFANPGIYAWVS